MTMHWHAGRARGIEAIDKETIHSFVDSLAGLLELAGVGMVIIDALLASVDFLPGPISQLKHGSDPTKRLRWAQKTSLFEELCLVSWNGKVAS